MSENALPEIVNSGTPAPENKEKKPKRRKLRGRFWRRVKKIVKLLVLTAVLLVAGLFALKAYITGVASNSKSDTQYSRAVVQSGAMSDTVYGTGTTAAKNQPSFAAEADGTLTELRVSIGDAVKEGDVLAVITNDDIDATVIDYELALWQLDAEIQDTSAGSSVLSVRAPMAGRVMALYGEVGEDTLAVFRREDALAIISTDGRMKVVLSDVPVGANLGLGDTVQVLGEGVDVTGTVSDLTLQGTKATITIVGDDMPMGAAVTVLGLDGTQIGEGILEVNKPMAVSAYGGVIKSVRAKVGQKVEREASLYTLEKAPLSLKLEDLRLQRETAARDLENAKAQRENLIVLAPCDGIIASIDVAEGDAITSGTVMGSILRGEDMKLTIAVDELDVVDVEIGQDVKITIDALSGVEFSGEVYKVAPVGTNSGGVTTYDVELTFDATGTGVRSGMNATGEIEIASTSNAVYVPVEAIMTINNKTYVMVEDGGKQSLASASQNAAGERSSRSGMQRGNMPQGMDMGNMPSMPQGMNMGSMPSMPQGMNMGSMPSFPEGMDMSSFPAMGGMPGAPEGVGAQADEGFSVQAIWEKALSAGKAACDAVVNWLYEDVELTADTVTGTLVEVTVGMQNDDYAQILSGVGVGQTVLYTSSSESSSSRYGSFGGMGGMGGMPMGGPMGF